MKSGFHQIGLDEESRKYTAFSTGKGTFEYTVCPFGLKNLPYEFSRIMRTLLADVSNVEHFMDDIIVHTVTLDEHVKTVIRVLERLKEHKLKINLSKCKFLAKEISILGHIVCNKHIKMDDKKIKCVIEREPPKNVKQLQLFLGLVNYYRRYIRDFSKKCLPLFQLLKKDVKYTWTDDCQSAFKQLKHDLVSFPVLRPPDFSRVFYIYTDASHLAVGAILSQFDDNGDEYVIEYGSSPIQKAAISWSTTEKECYAIIYAIKQFRYYVHGRKFVVVTDHIALKWLLGLKDPSGRLARWSAFMQQFDFDVVHMS